MIVDYDRVCQSLSNLGITFDPDHLAKDIEFCPCGNSVDNVLGYYRKWSPSNPDAVGMFQWRPIARARVDKKSLIGFLFEDGTIRQDGEILVSLKTGFVQTPKYVLFWRWYVPFNERKGLAFGGKLHNNRVIVSG